MAMTEELKKLAAFAEGEDDISVLYDEPMSAHTSFRIGGPAALFITPSSAEAAIRLCGALKDCGAKYYFLGNGTNVLFDDDGYDGAVISLAGLSKVSVDDEKHEITASTGASVASVCKAARDASLTGMEFAYGIPGSIGGAVYMNAGAYGGETSAVLKESTYLDLDSLTVHTISVSEHGYGYRESIYKHRNYLILSAVFALTGGVKEEIAALMTDIMNRRISKQPLEYPSAGSVFKRCEGHFTGQMIEESGLKGYTVGGAQISEKHAGFIVNRGGATSHDVLALVEHIKDVIRKNYGLELECEIIHVK